MTVAELSEILKTAPPTAKVQIRYLDENGIETYTDAESAFTEEDIKNEESLVVSGANLN